MSGWIKMFRKFDQWEWYDDHNTKIVFIHLLLKANHKDKKWRGIEIKRGQFFTSTSSLAEQLNLTDKQIRRALDNLISTGEVQKTRASKGAMITLCNYETYQDESIVTGQSKGNQRAIKGQQHKNEKNEKNEKNNTGRFDIFYNHPNIVKCCEAYEEHLEQLGKAYKKTDNAWKLFISKVGKFIDEYGSSVTQQTILSAIENNWKTIYEPKQHSYQKPIHQQTQMKIHTVEDPIEKMMRLANEVV